MPRKYIATVVLSDDYVDDSLTPDKDVEWLEKGHLLFDELIVVATEGDNCSVTYQVEDV